MLGCNTNPRGCYSQSCCEKRPRDGDISVWRERNVPHDHSNIHPPSSLCKGQPRSVSARHTRKTLSDPWDLNPSPLPDSDCLLPPENIKVFHSHMKRNTVWNLNEWRDLRFHLVERGRAWPFIFTSCREKHGAQLCVPEICLKTCLRHTLYGKQHIF